MTKVVWLRVALLAALIEALPLLGGCAPPKQYGGPIAVDQAGLGRRLTILCRLRAGDETARQGCQPEPPAVLPRERESASPVAQKAPERPSP